MSASTIMWVVRMILVSFSMFILLMNSLISVVDCGSSPSVGSSMKRTLGTLSSALMMFILCFIPVE